MSLLSVEETINEIVEEFNYFDEWEERYFYLIEMGKNLEKMDENLKTEENSFGPTLIKETKNPLCFLL